MTMGHLDSITSPQDLRALSDAELDTLAAEIRDGSFNVARIGMSFLESIGAAMPAAAPPSQSGTPSQRPAIGRARRAAAAGHRVSCDEVVLVTPGRAAAPFL